MLHKTRRGTTLFAHVLEQVLAVCGSHVGQDDDDGEDEEEPGPR